MTGTGVPFALRNLQTDQTHKEAPMMKKGRETALPYAFGMNSGNPKNRSMKNEAPITNKMRQKKKPANRGVRSSRIFSGPVTF